MTAEEINWDFKKLTEMKRCAVCAFKGNVGKFEGCPCKKLVELCKIVVDQQRTFGRLDLMDVKIVKEMGEVLGRMADSGCQIADSGCQMADI
jgi:hypothetical protein